MQVDDIFNRALISKICHDLITPASAIYNGFELLKLNNFSENNDSQDIISLLGDSIVGLNAKLSMFRACYGKNSIHLLQNEDVFKKTVDSFLQSSNVKVTSIEFTPQESSEVILILSHIIINIAPIIQSNTAFNVNVNNEEANVYIEGKFFPSIDLFLSSLGAAQVEIKKNEIKTISLYILKELVKSYGGDKIQVTIDYDKNKVIETLSIKLNIVFDYNSS